MMKNGLTIVIEFWNSVSRSLQYLSVGQSYLDNGSMTVFAGLSGGVRFE